RPLGLPRRHRHPLQPGRAGVDRAGERSRLRLGCLLVTGVALFAHGGGAELGSWTFDPALIWCVLGALTYALRHRRLAERRPGSRLLSRWRAAAFIAGLALVAVAVASPLDDAADELFSLHMVPHLVLALVAPLAIVAARPTPVLRWSLPPELGRALTRRGRVLARRIALRPLAPAAALVIVAIHIGVLSIWHLPPA